MMNKIKLIMTVAVTALSLTVLAQGLEFEKGTFAEAIAKAKADNKLVFIDFYTTWCGPCKKMDKDIFPKEIVGTYFNDKFISIKIDAEKGEGITLAKKYAVKGYPTLLVLNTDETEKDRLVGATPDSEFMVKFGKQVTGEGIDFLELYKAYEEDDRDPDYIRKVITEGGVYASTLKDREEQTKWFKKFSEMAKWYFTVKQPKDMLNAQDFKLIAMFLDGPNNRNPYVEFVYNHYEDYKKFVPVDELTLFVIRTNNQSIHEASRGGDLSFREYLEAINGRLKQPHLDAGSKDTYEVMKFVGEAQYCLSQDDIDGYLDWSDNYKTYQREIGKLEAVSYMATVGNLLYGHKDKLSARQIIRVQKLVEAGLKLDSKQASLITNQGDLYALQGKKDKAIECYNRVIEYSKGGRSEDYYQKQMTKKIDELQNS